MRSSSSCRRSAPAGISRSVTPQPGCAWVKRSWIRCEVLHLAAPNRVSNIGGKVGNPNLFQAPRLEFTIIQFSIAGTFEPKSRPLQAHTSKFAHRRIPGGLHPKSGLGDLSDRQSRLASISWNRHERFVVNKTLRNHSIPGKERVFNPIANEGILWQPTPWRKKPI